MCCFSKPVKSVNDTKIFARSDVGGSQFLVYSMTLDANQDLAMVLPLPVKEGTGEKGVRFITLKKYPKFFEDLDKTFLPPPRTTSISESVPSTNSVARTLEVVNVGNFEASFVPTIADFTRLDERFRMPAGVWEKLPGYRKFGFAVFKLKKGVGTIHPMAFSFPRNNASALFFPTVHIHDGEVHATAHFYHTLYCQAVPHEELALGGWTESHDPAGKYVKVDHAEGLIDAGRHSYRIGLWGDLPNKDTLLVGRS